MDKYQEALDRIKNKKAIIDGEKMTIGTAYCNTFPILQELINNYAKYKRAFEILKKVEYKKISASKCLGLTQINIETEQFVITNEECELLEELMKDE